MGHLPELQKAILSLGEAESMILLFLLVRALILSKGPYLLVI